MSQIALSASRWSGESGNVGEESQHRGEPFRYARADVPGGRGFGGNA